MAKQAGVIYLTEGTYSFKLSNGTKFTLYRSLYSPKFGDFVFHYEHHKDRFNNADQVAEGITSISTNPIPDFPSVDIVMTHGPPKGILDELALGKETLMIKASTMNHGYKPNNDPWIVDFDLPSRLREAKLRAGRLNGKNFRIEQVRLFLTHFHDTEANLKQRTHWLKDNWTKRQTFFTTKNDEVLFQSCLSQEFVSTMQPTANVSAAIPITAQ